MDERLGSVADLLLRDGYVDNTPDAYLAAIRILAAADTLAEDEVARVSAQPTTQSTTPPAERLTA